MTKTELAPIRRRRTYPKSLKAQIVAECRQPGASMAGIALSHGINANLVHRWIKQVGEHDGPSLPGFVPLMVSPPASRHIEIKLVRGSAQAAVQWPVSEVSACAAWLREWIK